MPRAAQLQFAASAQEHRRSRLSRAVLHRLPGTRILLPGVLPRGGGTAADGAPARMLPGTTGEQASYQNYEPPPAAGAPPSSDKYAQPGVFTATIDEVNRRLREYAVSSAGGAIHYVDCQSLFRDASGAALVPSLMRDALHPTAKGMAAWFRVLVPAVGQLMSLGPHALDAAQAAKHPPLPLAKL